MRTDDRASTPTKNSTWKHPNKDSIIFYAGSATEWRLGKKGHQNTNDYYFKGTYYISKYFFFFCMNIEFTLEILKEFLQWDILLTFFVPKKTKQQQKIFCVIVISENYSRQYFDKSYIVCFTRDFWKSLAKVRSNLKKFKTPISWILFSNWHRLDCAVYIHFAIHAKLSEFKVHL